MALSRLLFICLSLSIFVNTETIPENVAATFGVYSDEVAAVLSHIQSSKYVYKGVDLLNAQKKDDILQLLLNVNVDCISSGQDGICDAKPLLCDAFVRRTPERSVQVLKVNCTPVTTLMNVGNPASNLPQAKAALNSEAVSSEVGDQFVAIKRDSVPCLGCPVDLNPQAEGQEELVNIALKHIESERPNKQALVKTLKLQRQVDSSVKYILLIEVAPTVCNTNATVSLEACPLDNSATSSVCQIKFIQKPWISLSKHVFSNNCTVSQEFVQVDDKKPELSNEIDGPIRPTTVDTIDFGRIADGGQVDDLSPSRLEDLLSQIIVDEPDCGQSVVPFTEPDTNRELSLPSTGEQVDISPSRLEDLLSQIIVQDSNGGALPSTVEAVAQNLDVTNPETASGEEQTDAPTFQDTTVLILTKRDVSSESNSTESKEDVKSKSSSEEQQGTTQSSLPVEAARPKRAVRQLEKISPEEKSLVKNLADFAAAALDNIDDDNQKRVILQILGAKKMVADDGVNYHLIMRMGVSHCLEDTPASESCREKLYENYTKICKVQVLINDDFAGPKVVKSQCQNIKRDKNDSNRTNYSRFKRSFLAGAPGEIDSNTEAIKQLAGLGITHLNAQRGGNKYKPTEVVSATSQVVAGQLYRIKTKIAQTSCGPDDQKVLQACSLLESAPSDTCEVAVWEKLWENFRQFTIKCEKDDKAYTKTTTVADRIKRDVNIPGGELEVPLDDEYVVKYMEHILSDWDSRTILDNKLKVQEVVSATKQIVAGHKYRIKAKIVVSDCMKTATTERKECGSLQNSQPQMCSFEIVEQPWVPNSHHVTKSSCNYQSFDVEYTTYELFNTFTDRFNKIYTKSEYMRRLKIFRDNLNVIRTLNGLEQGTAVYGITKFADMTQSEFSKSLGLRPDLRNENEAPFAEAKIPDIPLPSEFDWRTKNAVTEVKNQEQCGSCWAFSVTGNVEGQYALKYGDLVEFSEQELVDCDTEDQGCNGGLMDTAYRVIEKLGGLESENDYPYEAEDEKCHFNETLTRVQLSGALNISQNETDMAKWLVANGPISIGINANAMQFYMGGVSHPFKFLCNPNNLDHGVLIVGYGVHTYPLFKKTLPYWIVKNSWGPSWGEQGYYRVYRGDGTCGLNQTPSSAIVA